MIRESQLAKKESQGLFRPDWLPKEENENLSQWERKKDDDGASNILEQMISSGFVIGMDIERA